MDGKRFLRRIRLQGVLSYGAAGAELELEPLNVLIGPNGAGKSNLIEVLGLLAAAPQDLSKAIRAGGGVDEWLWKGNPLDGVCIAEISVEAMASFGPLSYALAFTSIQSRLKVVEEELVDLGDGRDFFPYDFAAPEGESILAAFRDPVNHPKLTVLAGQLGLIRLFRGWNLGRSSEMRRPQQADLPDDFLLEDASNLALILNDLENRPGIKQALLGKLKTFYPRVENFATKIQGGTVQIFFHEQGLTRPVSAARLSDGSLQYLCLLSVLCHPEPPPLICLEEPEAGLHPDIIPELAKLLLEASQRTQLVVTTHSDMLVSALSEVPESVVVCERGEDGTQLRRLDPDKLREWLERYTLGELWTMGEIGGTRW
jgi:predicted ATPase